MTQKPSLIPRPSHHPVFDRFQCPETIDRSDQKLNGGKAWEQGYQKPHQFCGGGGSVTLYTWYARVRNILWVKIEGSEELQSLELNAARAPDLSCQYSTTELQPPNLHDTLYV